MISYANSIATDGYQASIPSSHRVPGADMYMLPRDLQGDVDDGDFGPPDPNDDADFGDGGIPGGVRNRADLQDQLADFIRQLADISSMSGPDISAIVADLPVPQDDDVEVLSVDEAVEVCRLVLDHVLRYHI